MDFEFVKHDDLHKEWLVHKSHKAEIILTNICDRNSDAWQIKPKVFEWLVSEIGECGHFGDWVYYTHTIKNAIFYFKREMDALKFKLMWG